MRRVALLCLFLLLVSCCGYSFRALLPPHLKTIAILPVENQTIKPGLDQQIADAFVADFQRDGTLRLTNPERADLTLHCQVTSYDKTPQAYTGAQEVSTWRLALTATMMCNDNARTAKLWEGKVSVSTSYDPSKVTEEQSVKETVAKLSAEVVRRTLIAW